MGKVKSRLPRTKVTNPFYERIVRDGVRLLDAPAKNPEIRCFDVVPGGGARPSAEREGRTFWPHSITIRFEYVHDVEDLVLRGVRWLRENGALGKESRERFDVDMVGEVVETDPETGEPLEVSRGE